MYCSNEQKLNYLQRCKNNNVFPVSILNGVRANCVRNTQYTRNLLMKIRKVALNQAIEDSHNCIRACKIELSGAKHQLYLNISNQFQLHEILYTAQNFTRNHIRTMPLAIIITQHILIAKWILM